MVIYSYGDGEVRRLERDGIEMNPILDVADKLSKERHVRRETLHIQGGPIFG